MFIYVIHYHFHSQGGDQPTRPVQVVSLLDTVVCSYSKQSSLRVMGFVTLGRYGRLQRVENWCCSLFIVFFFQIFDLCYRSTVFVHLSFSNIVLSSFWFVITQPPTHKFQPLMDFLKIFQTVSKFDITWRKVSSYLPSILNFEPNY